MPVCSDCANIGSCHGGCKASAARKRRASAKERIAYISAMWAGRLYVVRLRQEREAKAEAKQ